MLGANVHNPTTDDLLDIRSNPLFGANRTTLLSTLSADLTACDDKQSLFNRLSNAVIPSTNKHQPFLVAPFAAFRFDSPTFFPEQPTAIPSMSNFTFTLPMHNINDEDTPANLKLVHLSTYRNHINLDDMDFGDDGILPTLRRVIGRRGLGVWRVERDCPSTDMEEDKS